MNNDIFRKYLSSKRDELEYRLINVYYKDDYDHGENKHAYMFAQYVDVLSDVNHDSIHYNITAEQIEDITSVLGGLHLQYNLKVRGLSIGQGFKDFLESISGGQEIPDYIAEQINDIFEEDNKDEE